ERHYARIVCEEPAESAMHDGQSAVDRKLAENRLLLRLESVDMRRIRIVELEAECRKLRIADRDLDVLVVVVEAVDLRAQMSLEGCVFPAKLVAGQLLCTKRRRRTQAHRNIQAAGSKP